MNSGPEIGDGIGAAFSNAGQIAGAYLPQVLAAVAIGLLGWLAAVLARRLTRYVIGAAQRRMDRIKWLETRTHQLHVYRAAPGFVAAVVFWTVLLFFLVAAIETLGLPEVSGLLARVANYLPRVVLTVLIICAGLFAGDIVKNLAARALAGMGIAYRDAIAGMLRTLVVIVACIIGVEQLGVDSTILTLGLAIVFATTLGAAGLAFGLGARDMVGDMLAVQQAAKHFEAGDTIRGGDVEGRIAEFTQTAVVLDLPDGRTVIAGRQFADERWTRLQAAS